MGGVELEVEQAGLDEADCVRGGYIIIIVPRESVA